MRDKLIHHYFDVDGEMVYKTCKADIPELMQNFKLTLSTEQEL